MKLTIPHHPTVEGLTDSFIAWYKDHDMTASLRKALEVNRWTEKMIQEFQGAYIRKYKILQDYAVRYLDEKLSDEDEMEGGGLADLVDPRRKTCPKDSGRGAEGSMSERATKKKEARKTNLPDPPGGEEKKAVKCKKGQGNEPKPMTSGSAMEKQQKGERKKKKKRKAGADADEPIPKKKKAKGNPIHCPRKGTWHGITASAGSATGSCLDGHRTEDKLRWTAGGPSAWHRTPGHSGPTKPDHSQLDGTSGSRHGRFLGWTQKVYSSGWNTTGSGDHPCPEAIQADLDTSSCG